PAGPRRRPRRRARPARGAGGGAGAPARPTAPGRPAPLLRGPVPGRGGARRRLPARHPGPARLLRRSIPPQPPGRPQQHRLIFLSILPPGGVFLVNPRPLSPATRPGVAPPPARVPGPRRLGPVFFSRLMHGDSASIRTRPRGTLHMSRFKLAAGAATRTRRVRPLFEVLEDRINMASPLDPARVLSALNGDLIARLTATSQSLPAGSAQQQAAQKEITALRTAQSDLDSRLQALPSDATVYTVAHTISAVFHPLQRDLNGKAMDLQT